MARPWLAGGRNLVGVGPPAGHDCGDTGPAANHSSAGCFASDFRFGGKFPESTFQPAPTRNFYGPLGVKLVVLPRLCDRVSRIAAGCVVGVNGSNLRRRIGEIMTDRKSTRLN